MDISRQQLIRGFVSHIHGGNAALFIGAGMSRESGYVDWKGLLRSCAAEIGLDLEREHDLVAVAQYYLNRRGGQRWNLNQILKNEFEKHVALTRNHRIIGRLPVNTIWTTNFDSLVEQALLEADRRPDIKSRDADVAHARKDRDIVLYKMHGDIARPDEVVICKGDYERYARLHPIFQNALEGDLISKTFLFLGFSFTDPNLNYMLGHLHSLLEGSQREHYAVMRRVRLDHNAGEDGRKLYEYEQNKQDLLVRELQRYNIQTHLIEQFSEVTTILESIEDHAHSRNVFVSGSASRFDDEFDENRMRDLCMHLGEMLMDKHFKLVSGFGLNIGDSVIKGALLRLYDRGHSSVEEHLMLRPFPRNLPADWNEAAFNQKYRHSMISKAGAAIFIAGTSRSSPISAGVMQEYEIVRSLKKYPIPVGASGFAARKIWELMQPDIDRIYGGTVSAELFARLNNAELSNQQILNAVFEILAKVTVT